jgi:divalent metal cation (Fe/Co/Zn/Cd) transporter
LRDVRFVQGIEEIHAHRFGPYLVANITITIDGNLCVTEADAIATATEKKLLSDVEMLRKVFVHCHPVRKEGGGSKGGPSI